MLPNTALQRTGLRPAAERQVVGQTRVSRVKRGSKKGALAKKPKVRTGATFENRDIRGRGELHDREFDRCVFRSCSAVAEGPLGRPVLRRIRAVNCRLESCDALGAIFDDCTFDGLRFNRMPLVYGCAFRHVVFRGDFGRVLIRGSSVTGKPNAIDHANDRFYETVDWALDITEVRSSDLEIHDVPLHLVRRNPETQAVILRRRLSFREMKRLGIGPTASQFLASFFPDDPDRKLRIANVRSRNFADQVQAIAQLRAVGLAE